MYGVPISQNPGLTTATVSAFGGLRRGLDQKFDYFIVDGHTETTPVELASGQILKARTLLQRNAAGKAEAYGAFNASYAVTLDGTWAATETAVIAGITFTASASVTDEQIVKAFATYSDLQRAGKSSEIATHPDTSIGVFTGSWTDTWTFAVDESSQQDSSSNSVLIVSSTVPLTMVTALATPTETAAAGTISTALKAMPGEVALAFNGSGLVNTGTVTIGGVIYTASATNSPAEIVAAFVAGSSAKGTFSGTNAGFTFTAGANSNILLVKPNTSNTTGTPLNVQTSATAAQVGIMQAPTVRKPVIGVLAFDVNASSANTWTQMFTEAHMYFEGIKWENTITSAGAAYVPTKTIVPGQDDTYEGIDFVINGDGTANQCTAYYTGINDYSSALQLIENSAGGTELKITSWELTPGEKRNEW